MIEKIGGVFAGAGAVVGVLAVTINGLDRHVFEALLEILSGGFAGAFGGYILGLILGAMRAFGSGVADELQAGGNPFKVGLRAASLLFGFLAVFDLILFRGNFVLLPLISILTTGSLDGTYWTCPEGMYDCVEEGCACFQN